MSVYKASSGIRWYSNLTERQIDASYAVIEAAKNKVTLWRDGCDFDADSRTDIALIEAVEALQEVEGE